MSKKKNRPFIKLSKDSFAFDPYNINPIEGFKFLKSNNGDSYPNCCEYHKDLKTQIEEKFKEFPDCCEPHKEMKKKWWFDESRYSNIVEKILNQIAFTEYHIKTQINKEYWYKDITDYIEYNVMSFGVPSIGVDSYLDFMKHWITNSTLLTDKTKSKKIFEFIVLNYDTPVETTKSNRASFDELYKTYENWLNIFPFEVSFFNPLKSHFEKQIPVLYGKFELNKYTGDGKAKMHTKGSLLTVLMNLTNDLVTRINTSTLYEKGKLTEPKKIKMELILSERKMKLKEGYLNNSQIEEKQFRNILKNWFADERKFIDEIIPLVKELPPPQVILDENKTKKVIDKAFKGFDVKGWKYAFVTEQDFKLFTSLLINFFEMKPLKLPKKVIKLKRGCKTKVASLLGELHQDLSNRDQLVNDNDYFALIKVLNHFENVNKSDLYKALTR